MEQQKQRPKQGRSLTRKIIEAHYVKGSLTPGEEVFLRVDQTLTHDIWPLRPSVCPECARNAV